MSDAEIRAQVDAFVALPRAERRAQYPNLPPAVKTRARKIIEARRGIAYRMNGGVVVRTKEGYINLLTRNARKLAVLPKRIETLQSNMVELKEQLRENYGDEALAEVETLLESEAPANQ